MEPRELAELARVAAAAADAARVEIAPRFRRSTVETKADGTPVTEADRAAEQAIRAVLREHSPEIAILGEEFGQEGAADGARLWVVDPIDGTIAFARGIPLFGTLIALLDGAEPVLGLIDLPMLDERYLGWRGGGVRCNGEPVRVSQRASLDDAIVSHGDGFAFGEFGESDALPRLATDLRILRGYTDAFGHAMVLRGAVDVMVDLALSPWDVMATRALVTEAGGECRVLDRDGQLGLVFGAPALVARIAAYLG